MSRNGPEFREMYNNSDSFEQKIAILYWFINNANELWIKYYEDNPDEEKLEYEKWLKKEYGLSIANITNYYNILKKDDKKRKIIEDTEAKIISGEIDPFAMAKHEKKETATNKKHSINGKKGAEVTNPIKRKKAEEKRIAREKEMEKARLERKAAREAAKKAKAMQLGQSEDISIG